MKKLFTISCVCLIVAACQDTRFVFSNQIPAQPSYSRTQHYTWWGKKSTIDPAQVCGYADNVAMVEEKENAGQSWLRALTLGIYSPATVNVYCKRPVRTNYRAQQPS